MFGNTGINIGIPLTTPVNICPHSPKTYVGGQFVQTLGCLHLLPLLLQANTPPAVLVPHALLDAMKDV